MNFTLPCTCLTSTLQIRDVSDGNPDIGPAMNSGSASNSGMYYYIGMNFIVDILCPSDWLVGAVPLDDRVTDWMDIDMNDVLPSR